MGIAFFDRLKPTFRPLRAFIPGAGRTILPIVLSSEERTSVEGAVDNSNNQ